MAIPRHISKVRTYNVRRDVGSLINDETVLYLNEDKKAPKMVSSLWDTSPFRGNQIRIHKKYIQDTKSVNSFSENPAHRIGRFLQMLWRVLHKTILENSKRCIQNRKNSVGIPHRVYFNR